MKNDMVIKINKDTKGKKEFQKIIEQICLSKEFRKEIANNDMFWFFSIYFAKYIEYPTAKFQKEIISLVSNEKNRIVVITAFRNSAKSTTCSLVLPIWSIIGKWKKKHVVIVCQTQTRAKETLANVRTKLETLGLLVEDYQPKEGKRDKWSENAIIIPKHGAKISAISTSESIRGIRHHQYRPDLIIADDLESVPSCQNYESRKKLWQFVNGELIPAGDKNTKYVFIGNKVHNDSLMMKLKKAIESGKMKGVYREYPLIDKNEKIAWPGKFPNMTTIKELKGNYASEIDFLREQMLMILPDGDAIIKPEDIHYYEKLPKEKPDYYIVSIDPAFSEASTSDNTAIVVMGIYKDNKRLKIYVLTPIINKKLSTDQLIEKVKEISSSLDQDVIVKIYVENVSAQKTIVDMLLYANIPAEGVGIGGKDKKTRLSAIAPLIKNGQILFLETGMEVLINQTLYLGTERYDDAVDALTLAVNKLIKDENQPADVVSAIMLKEPLRDSVVNQSVKSNNMNFYSQVTDWADKEDEEIFRKNGMGNLHRIYG
jgi:predicted phage terminase large subunit-like protein